VGALQRVQQGGHQLGAGGAKRVAERDRSPADVDPREVGTGFALPCDHNGCKSLVDLDKVHVVQRHAGLAQCVARRGDRAGQHHHRVVPARRHVHDPRLRRQPELADRVRGGDEHRRRAVGDLTGQRRRDQPALAQRFEPGHLLERCVPPRAFVAHYITERRYLGLKVPRIDRGDGAPVALVGEPLHLLAGDPPLRGDHVRAAELGYLLRAVTLAPALRTAERVAERRGHGGRDRDHRHVLHAAGDHQVRGA
jgi:hypothetical protein